MSAVWSLSRVKRTELRPVKIDVHVLPGRNPAAVADALVTLLLAHVIVHNAHDPATMAAALALAVDQDDADVEPGKRGNQRDTLAQ
jgi:hypothetical protein